MLPPVEQGAADLQGLYSERAEHYRQQAAQLRKMAGTVPDGSVIRFQFLDIARQYDELAISVENRFDAPDGNKSGD